jgi:ribonuclease VapC
MVVDTSAVIALLLGEAEAESIDATLRAAHRSVMSAANHVELMMVVESRAGAEGVLIVESLLGRFDVSVEAVTQDVARLAIDGWRRFGKSRHPAGLNFGDCFSYGLAIALDEPLLFVGTGFALTDVRAALDEAD